MIDLTDTADDDIVNRVLAGETALYEILMRRYNQRLYRVARSILRNDVEAEDVKTRLHRARSLLRKDLQHRAGLVTAQAFPFHLSRCDRVVEAVFRRINTLT